MMYKLIIILYFSIIILYGQYNYSQQLTSKGQVSSWAGAVFSDTIDLHTGVRVLPEFHYTKNITQKYAIGAEFSFNTFGTAYYKNHSFDTLGQFKPYRAQIRFSSQQFECRLGLQKLNFGSATILRPLMWFEKSDSRDPLKMTDGVYGLLLRYFFRNNANIWLWGLYGNDELKGWESFETKKDIPEFGGRFQYPLLNGEMAMTYHNRTVNYTSEQSYESLSYPKKSQENRIGIDGRWDKLIGFWIESSCSYKSIAQELYPWQVIFNAGFDYTFGIGNGLFVINENMFYAQSKSFLRNNKSLIFSALTLNYPVSLFDNVSGMVYYDWTNTNLYRFISWQRTYDTIRLYLMLWWNPETFEIYRSDNDTNLFGGKGIQFMFVYNY